jgi:hypothetical protein
MMIIAQGMENPSKKEEISFFLPHELSTILEKNNLPFLIVLELIQGKCSTLEQVITSLKALLSYYPELAKWHNNKQFIHWIIMQLSDRFSSKRKTEIALMWSDNTLAWLKDFISTDPEARQDAEKCLLETKDPKKMRLLLSVIDINMQDSYGNSILILATHKKNGELVQLLLNAGAKGKLQNKTGCTALMYAVLSQNLEIVKLLLEKDALDIQDETGTTALIYASWKGNSEIVQALVEAGAATTIQDNKQKTALSFAQENRNSKIINIFTESAAH